MTDALGHQEGQASLEVKPPTRSVNWFKLRSELEAMRVEDRWVPGSFARSGLGLLNRALAGPVERDRRADPRRPWL